MTTRYADLVKSVVGGSYYESKGVVIPYRYGTTEIRLETDSPSTEFGLYVNEFFSGTVTSDVVGNVVFNRVLPRGEVQFQLVNHVTGRKLNSWVTVREYALWLAAYATVLENIDDNIQTVRDDLAITTATIGGVEDNFGQYVGFYNDLGMDLDCYRVALQELRLGFRNYGGQFGGFDAAVGAITQVPPFGYSRRMWGPNWVLDRSFITNHRYQERSHTLTNAGGAVTGVTLVSAEPDVLAGAPAGTLSYSNITNELTWSPFGVPGPAVEAKDGELFLPGPASNWPAHIVGDLNQPFATAAGINDYLYLTVDEAIGGGYIAIQLVTGLPGQTAAQVAADINAALVADPRFGAPYAGFAQAYSYGADIRMALVSPVAAGSSIRIENGVQNAAPTVFGIVNGDLHAAIDLMTGVQFMSAEGPIDINMGNAAIGHQYDGTTGVHQLAWASPGGAPGAWVTIADPIDYDLLDAGGATLTVHASPDDMDVLAAPWPALDVVAFSLTYQRYNQNLAQVQGLNVIVDTTALPAAVVTDNIDLVDDSVLHYAHPNYWFTDAAVVGSYVSEGFVITDRLNPSDPSSSYAWWLATLATDLSINSHVEKFPVPWPANRGSNYPQRSFGGLYDYEGFDVVVSCWVKNLGNPSISVRSKISLDGGVTYYYGAWTLVPFDNWGYGRSTFVTGTFRIDDAVKFSSQENVDIIVGFDVTSPIIGHVVVFEAPTADVVYISSRYLGNATVPRDRHQQYFGELAYVWSRDELSLRQKQYLGLQHKTADKTTPMAGVTIDVISADTPAGAGTLEYEYNALGDTRRLRWSAYGTTWGPGLGWVSILSTGPYTLAASDGSYLTTTVTRDILPILSGTPPAATTSKTVTVSDTSVYQGLTREILPAHVALDIFDVTEYDALGTPKNLFGAITEADFAAAELINLDIQSADPFMYSYLTPSELPVSGEALSVDPALHTASLTYESDQDQLTAVLYGDGLPIPNTDSTGAANWWFNSSTQIEMTAATYALATDFTIDYNLLYQITTEMFTVNPYEGDYAFFVDHLLWDRRDSVEGEYLTTVPVYFSSDTGQAYLDRKSSMDTTVAVLYYQAANEQKEIAKRYWKFVRDSIIAIDSSQLVSGSQFFLTHTEKRTYEVSSLATGLRAVPSTLDLLSNAITIDFISGTGVGSELTVEYELQAGPTYLLRIITAGGGIGAQVAIPVSGSYQLFDDEGNFVNVSIDLLLAPAVIGVYSQTVQVKNSVRFQHRKGVDFCSCLLADWRDVERNEAVSSTDNSGVLYPIHQLRLAVGGIRDLRDFRIRSLVMKGLNLHSGTPNTPGITNLWT
jgi:hypothetical protein